MSGCTETGKPLISILMAVYEPRMDWLSIQLQSLNAQTYPRLRLYIRDDCSPTVPFEQIQSCVQDCISAFPYEIRRNEENLGSNGTFEQLTRETEGDLFAYCDQDDEWLPEKLTVLQAAMEESGALLACSDMYIMDADGQVTADSITKVRRHHVFHSGTGLAEGLLITNFVTGCTMLVSAREAKSAAPFCPYMVHDHYLALWCAEKGTVLSLPQPLIRYRIHGGNQTGLMAGVHDKASYGRVRIDAVLKRMEWLHANLPCSEELCRTLDEMIVWLDARQRNWNHHGCARLVWKYRCFSMLPSISEMILKNVPDSWFMNAISLVRKNHI
ncbi:glycosyltransferase [Oscillibacter sp.]|uniref:glycosyltransferase n=1 Tax=Oscillibacter sp. TaxID=1945593 RepID=UPI0028AB483D|nr:glycosyltransferase [Oscillibacter sp.]